MKEIKNHEIIEKTLITSRHNFSPSETFSSRNRLQVTDQGLPMENTRQALSMFVGFYPQTDNKVLFLKTTQ